MLNVYYSKFGIDSWIDAEDIWEEMDEVYIVFDGWPQVLDVADAALASHYLRALIGSRVISFDMGVSISLNLH